MTTNQVRNAVENASHALSLLPETATSPEVFLELFRTFLNSVPGPKMDDAGEKKVKE